ncbi:peptidoglycan DD-metalloendopeptidase family protein [Paenibacillus sp. sgz302251]|uniref:peptidoglycan DD-metalloendopeptidase family protein n=1 Tax=Paenibacillus sp. sgz302251 TaxID=3414493 RepID=UPI003C7A9843
MQSRDELKHRKQQKTNDFREQPNFDEDARELDPEKVWKTNPNHWASWNEDKGAFDRRSYVRGSEKQNSREPHDKLVKHSFRKELQWKLLIALLLFAAIWTMFRYDNEWTLQGQSLVKQALTHEIDFAAAAAWYKEHFAGAPTFIPIFQDESQTAIGADGTVMLPIVAPMAGGSLVRTFAELLNGVELAGESEQPVVAVETGRVLLLNDQAEDGSTVVIQHANQRVTVYGKLGFTEVNVNDWVEAGEPIGKLQKAEDEQPSLLYFAVKQNDRYVDPMGVIPID